MPRTRTLLLFLILIFSLSWFSSSGWWKKTKATYTGSTLSPKPVSDFTVEKIHAKAAQARIFVRQNNYNENICFLLDMSIPSGQNRFFIYDLRKDSLRRGALVAHGNCFEYWLEGRKYSNVVGSGCTSLGKYKIGNPYTGKFGLSYKLHGLDSSNSNAFERTVVLHAHSCVAETEVADDICQSNGCPTVSTDFLKQLKSMINGSKKPVLLWIYE
jgi:hypothetical protein